MFAIILSAIVKLPWFTLLSTLPGKMKWTIKKRAWTYLGVMKYSMYSFKRLLSK